MTYRDYTNLAQKSCQIYSPVIALYEKGIWKGDIMIANIEELEGDGNIGTPRLETQCKGSENANEK